MATRLINHISPHLQSEWVETMLEEVPRREGEDDHTYAQRFFQMWILKKINKRRARTAPYVEATWDPP